MKSRVPSQKLLCVILFSIFSMFLLLDSTLFSTNEKTAEKHSSTKSDDNDRYLEKKKQEEGELCKFMTQCVTEDHVAKEPVISGLVNLASFLGEPDLLKIDNEDNNVAVVLFISCNWYDFRKAGRLVELMQKFPNAKAVITGGIGRLSSQHAEHFGGEAMVLRDLLITKYKVDAQRLVIMTGLHTTGDNVDFMLRWIELMVFNKNPLITNVYIVAIEESFLIRRLRATLLGRLAQGLGTNFARKIAVQVIATTTENSRVPTPFEAIRQLSKLHNDSFCLVTYFVYQEMHKLVKYSNPDGFPFLFDTRLAFGSHIAAHLNKKMMEIHNELGFFFVQVEELIKLGRRVAVKCLAPKMPRLH